LKAKLCVDGNLRRLEPYCQEHGVPFKRIGKILVATDESQIEKLRDFQRNAKQNGVSAWAVLQIQTSTQCRMYHPCSKRACEP